MMDNFYNLLILEDDEYSLENLRISLSPIKNYKITFCSNPDDALSYLNQKFDLIISDLKLPGSSGVDIIKEFKLTSPAIKSIIITGYSDEPLIIRSLKEGINDIIKKPYEEIELHNSIKNQLKQINLEKENILLKEKVEKENIVLKSQLNKKIIDDEYLIVGESKLIKDILSKAIIISKHGLNTLISGESGTGKELLARYIHRNGPRKNQPFVPINCAEISPSIFESELFGYEKGSFTDAHISRAGLVEVANNGILYLDEVTEIPHSLQSKLLRVVEESKVRRLGSNDWLKVDIQIISSTNRNIDDAITKGILRNDLFHRLSETQIFLPPLRERTDDFELLIKYFINKYEQLLDLKAPIINAQQFNIIRQADWPGNLRQLSNFLKAFCLFGNEWDFDDFIHNTENGYSFNRMESDCFKFSEGTMLELEEAKYWLINRALNKFNGNKSKTAEHLGITYQGLLKMLNKRGM